jgi:hypothetical protein
MTKPDYQLFLRLVQNDCDVNAWDDASLDRFAENAHRLRPPELRAELKAQLARAVVEQSLSEQRYESATGWYFDSKADYIEHLREMWRHLYPGDEPEKFVASDDAG